MLDEDLSDFLDIDEFGDAVVFSRTASPINVIIDSNVQIELDGEYLSNQVTIQALKSDVTEMHADEYFTAGNGAVYTFLRVIEDDNAFVLMLVSFKPSA
jgi:hypothetical protein